MRRTWYNKKYSVGDIAMKAWTAVKYMKTLINSERKLYDFTQTGFTVDYTGTVIRLSDITQGDATNQRNGRSVLANYLLFQGNCARVTADSLIRIILFRDKMQTGTAASTDQLLQTVGSQQAVFSSLDASFAGRFDILSNINLNLNSATGTNRTFKRYVKLNKHIKWQTVATGGNPMEGHLYVLIISDQSAASANKPIVQFCSRIGYRDN